MSHHRAVRRRPPAIRCRPALLIVVAVLGGLLTTTAVAPSAVADVDDLAPPAAPRPLVDLQLSGVQAVVTQAGDEIAVTGVIDHHGTEDLTEVTVELAAHDALTTRGAFQRALDAPPGSGSRRLGPVVGAAVRPASDVPAGGRRFVSVSTSLDELGLDRGTPSVRPLSLSLVGDPAATSRPRELARAVTALVIAPPQVDVPVAASLLVRLLGLDPATRDGDEAVAWVPPVAQALTEVRAPVSVAADPLLARTIAGASVTDLLASTDVARVAVPFASADLDAVVAAELGSRARAHVLLGLAPWPGDPESALSSRSADVRHDLVVAPAAPLRASTAAGLLAGRAPAIVVPHEGVRLDPAREGATSPGPLRPLGDVGGVVVLVGDPSLSRALADRPELDEADVQRVVAETALLWLERPGAPERRGLLLDPGATWRPSPDGLPTLLRALDDAPWLQLTDAADLLDVEESPSARLEVPTGAPPELSPAYLAALEDAWTLVDAATGILTSPAPESPGGPLSAPNAADNPVDADGITAGLRLDLLRAASVAFRGEEDAGRALIARARASAGALVAGVQVLSQPTITLTDETGRLPVVVRNDSGSPLRVRVALRSRRLTFPSPAQEVTLAPQTTTTVVFEARARTPGGTSPVDVTVTDPSGERALAAGTMVVRIASYPVSALVVLGAVALVLLGTWLRGRLLRRRTDRPPLPGRTDVGERTSSAEQR